MDRNELTELYIIFSKWIRHNKNWDGRAETKPWSYDELMDFLVDKYNTPNKKV